jgi:aldose 1-epimerase
MIRKEDFEKEYKGKKVLLFKLTNSSNLEVLVTNYGARIVSLFTPDRTGRMQDVVLGYSTLDAYLLSNSKYFGSTVGRYANRIANGRFEINGKEYLLEKNNGNNHLHSGSSGFHDVVWNATQISDNTIILEHYSKDGSGNYPGNLDVKLRITLSDDNSLELSYTGQTDKTTHVNFTNHSYFNLTGDPEKKILDHILEINSKAITEVNEHLIPSGNLIDIRGSALDFTSPKAIGKDIGSESLKNTKGYDHNYVLSAYDPASKNPFFAARVEDPLSGRTMEVYTNEPGMQLFTSNTMKTNRPGKNGLPYLEKSAFCLETQHFPDSPNQSGFPTTLLKPGQLYSSICIYKFGLTEE